MDIFPKTTSKNKIGQAETEEKPKFKIPNLASFTQRLPSFRAGIKERKWSLILSLLILALVILIWLGLFFYKNSLDKNISHLKQQIESLKSKENKEMEVKIIDLEKNLKIVKSLLAQHIYSSSVFNWLGKLTLAQVQWKSFDLKTKTGQVSLKGKAAAYNILAKQILIFEEERQVKSVKSSGIALDQLGGIGFNMELILDSKIFSK